MSFGKEIGDAILDLSECIYNAVKKNGLQIELIEVITNGSNKDLFMKNEWPIFFKKAQPLSTIEELFSDGIDECAGKIFRFNVVKPGKIFNGIVQFVFEENDSDKFVPTVFLGTKPSIKTVTKAKTVTNAKTVTKAKTATKTKIPTISQIIKKHKLNALESDVFKNYVEYMNAESKPAFLEKVFKGDREYINQFIDTDLEDFGQERFGEIDYGDKRKQNVDMYDMVKNKNTSQILLVYAGFLNKVKDVPKEVRKSIYVDHLRIKKDKYNAADIVGKREIMYNKFNIYLSLLDQPLLEKFIDDIFDRKVTIQNSMNAIEDDKPIEVEKTTVKVMKKNDPIVLQKIMTREDMGKWLAQNRR
jgi:hypothetical protein